MDVEKRAALLAAGEKTGMADAVMGLVRSRAVNGRVVAMV